MISSLEKIRELLRENGGRYVLTNKNGQDDLVVLLSEDFERLCGNKTAGLDKLTNQINEKVDIVKAASEDLPFIGDDNLTEDEEALYFEEIPEIDNGTSKNEQIVPF